jgi:putative phosphoribosyl transferase
MQSAIFNDRINAAERLASRLLEYLQEVEEQEKESLIILAIPRGGVIIGHIIASVLGAKLDIVVSRKIGAPFNPELAMGAVMPDGSSYLNYEIIRALNIPQDYIKIQSEIQAKEIERRLISFRGSKDYGNEMEGKIVVLVDDGIATGATILASAKWIRNKHNCKKLVIAVPVAPRDITDDLNQVADKAIVLYYPIHFEAVGQFYKNFEQVSDTEVKEIMKRHGYKI